MACSCAPCVDYREHTPRSVEFANSIIAYSAAELDNMNKRERKYYLLQRVANALRAHHDSGRTMWRFIVSNGVSSAMVCRKAFQLCYFLTRYSAQNLMRLVIKFVFYLFYIILKIK